MLLRYARVLPAAALVVGLIGLLRLGRQFPAAADSPGLLIPFLKPVLALALEAGALTALSAAALPLAARVGPAAWLTRARAFVPLLGVLLATLALAELLPRGTERPGALANDLVDRALAGCDDGTSQVPVPLLGLNVRCGKPPRLEGPMPGAGSIQVGMQQLRFADDLRSVRITGLELSTKRALSLHLKVSSARIAGLAPWTRSPRLAPLTRFWLLSGVAVGLLVGVLAWWRPPAPPEGPAAPRWRRLLSELLVASPGAAAAALVISLDQRQAEPVWYALSALSALGLLVVLRLLAGRLPHLFGSGGAF